MKEHVSWMLELEIQPGKANALKTLAAEMAEKTQEHEPGTLIYEWFIDEEESTCHIYERYADSEAVLIHLGNFQKHFAERFFEVLEVDRWLIYGSPNKEVREGLSGMGAMFMSQFEGFSR